jgi:drug/metabolite transporter (DMT)-like permease
MTHKLSRRWRNQFPAEHSQQLLALVAGLLTIALFALSPTTTRIAVAQIDGRDIGLLRAVGGSAMAITLVIAMRIHPPRGRTEWRLLGLFSIGSFVLFPVLFSIGTQITSATHTSLIMASMPLATGAIGFMLEGKRPRGAWLLGAAFGLAGETALVLAAGGGPSTEPAIAGDLIVLAACVSFCIGAVAGSRLTTRFGPWRPTLWAIALAGVVLLPATMSEMSNVSIAAITPATWLALIHLCFGASVIASVAWPFALARGGIARIAPLQFAQSLLAVVLAAALLGERISTAVLLCGILILLGLVVAWRGASPLKAQETAETGRSSGPPISSEQLQQGGELVSTIIKRYPDVSQFWTYEEKAFLANPVYTRDYPPTKNLEP